MNFLEDKRKILIIFGIVILVLVFWIFGSPFFDFFSNLFFEKFYKLEEQIGQGIDEIKKQISLPPPLRSEENEPGSFLTKSGVIKWTNVEREKQGLAPLKENIQLDESANLKTEDMFKNQYFAHQSLSGEGMEDLVKEVDYNFIAIGENLALGNFKDDQDLVLAWMNSPGHRANILNPKYTEIGVSVVKGTFEGKITWFAVQHFGLPLAACPSPQETLKSRIDANESHLRSLEREINNLLQEINGIRPRFQKDYSQKVQEYNNLISEYNNLVSETKNLINQYNLQVQQFNNCVNI